MSYRTEESNLVVVKFSQWEGQQLLDFLDHLIGLADSRLDLAALVSALESVGDANALARWLREDVACELRTDEAAAVLQALEVGPACCEKCASVTAALGGVTRKLKKTVLGGQSSLPAGTPAAAVFAQSQGACAAQMLATGQ